MDRDKIKPPQIKTGASSTPFAAWELVAKANLVGKMEAIDGISDAVRELIHEQRENNRASQKLIEIQQKTIDLQAKYIRVLEKKLEGKK